jgi:5-methyltetrahydropteroyltriglutamate--homocysteine methyltransferase
MEWNSDHPQKPNASFDGADLDCGNGLLILIRKHLGPLEPDQVLEILSTDATVEDDLPAWARLTGNEIISKTKNNSQRSYLVRKGKRIASANATANTERPIAQPLEQVQQHLPRNAALPAFTVTGIGSWPRPQWMLKAIHERLENRISDEELQATANDAIRLVLDAQDRAGVDLVTDGEQRRDSYASFVGSRLANCQLIPISDLLPYVDDPEKFAEELKALDVQGSEIHHPAVLGPISRSKPLVLHELQYLQSITHKPCKVALPGPYLLTRTLWLECLSEKIYQTREELASAVIKILREEIQDLITSGATIIQLDEPVLTEVVFGKPAKQRSFMCGALGEKLKATHEELEFAAELLSRTLEGFPKERLALHICRGNWSKDESVALAGDYRPLMPLLEKVPVGILFLELCTPRAGEMEVLANLPESYLLGLGMVNPKSSLIESVEEIVKKATKAANLFGPRRILLNPDCGFATFADSPLAPSEIAEAKMYSLVQAARILRQNFNLI